jgi:hypothetical protein
MRTLVRVCGVVPALIIALLLTGCPKKKAAPAPPPESGENPIKPVPSGGPAQGVVRRGAQRQVNQNLLRNIGQYYALFRTERGQPPMNQEEFKAYVKGDPNARNEAQALESGWVVMVFTPSPSANPVLAYEKEPFEQFNNRLVLFADGSVKLLTEPEFRTSLKGQ